MGEVVKFKTSGVDEILAALKEIAPDELVVLIFKDNEYVSYASDVQSRTKTIGALELLKFDLLSM